MTEIPATFQPAAVAPAPAAPPTNENVQPPSPVPPAAQAAQVEGVPVTGTFAGVEITIEPLAFEDVVVLGYLYDFENGNQFAIVKVMEALLGEEQYKRLTAALALQTGGRATVTALFEVFEQINELADGGDAGKGSETSPG